MKAYKSKIGYLQEEMPIHIVQFSEIISSIKPFINISRIFGIPSFSVVENVVSKGGVLTFFGLLNIFLLLNQIILFILRITKGEDYVKKSGPSLILRLHVICVHIWCIFFSQRLAAALRNSLVVENRINKVYNVKTVEFIHPWLLRRKCFAWSIAFLVLGLGLTVKAFPVDVVIGHRTVSEVWEDYGEMCGLDKNTFFLPSISSAYCLVMEIATNFVWLFGDFLLVILSIILTEMFKRINERGITRIDPTQLTSTEIDLIREHHGLVSKLVKEFDDAVSALNLISLVFNVAFLIVGVYSVITLRSRERERMKAMLIKLYSKLVICAVKLTAGFVAASILHYTAHQALADVRSWPMAREFQDFVINNGRVAVLWKDAKILNDYPAEACLIVQLNCKTESKRALGVLKDFLAWLDTALGGAHDESGKPSETILLYIFCTKRKNVFRILGCVIVESIEHDKVICCPITPNAESGSKENVRMIFGITRLWTEPSFRRKQIATRLVDAVRVSWAMPGFIVPKHQIGILEPSEDGKSFMTKYTNGAGWFYTYF